MNGLKRIELIDTVRGFLLINMILYHTIWDMVYIYGISVPLYGSEFSAVWQRMICCGFILLSGICRNIGKNHVKRGIAITLSGIAVTAVTCIFMPENRIVFGILTFLGAAALLPFEKLKGGVKSAVLSLFLFFYTYGINSGYVGIYNKISLPQSIYRGYFTAFPGFPGETFYSADYFPLFPWIFLYTFGVFAGKPIIEKLKTSEISGFGIPLFSFCGKHSLLIYMLHQPVIYFLTAIFFGSV